MIGRLISHGSRQQVFQQPGPLILSIPESCRKPLR
jgi:hypothetical protein